MTFDTRANAYKFATLPENGGRVVLSVDPAKGFSIVKKELFLDGLLKMYWGIELAQAQGAWLPKVIQQYDVVDGAPVPARIIKLIDIELNPQIDPAIFSLEFPPETRVLDSREDNTSGDVRSRLNDLRKRRKTKKSQQR